MFWERYKELTDWQKWISVIERGEERIEKKIRIKQALAQKVAQYQKPEIQLKMAPGYSKSTISDIFQTAKYIINQYFLKNILGSMLKTKKYIEDEDRFLVCKLNEIGMDNENVYDQIKQLIRNEPRFRFDWFFRYFVFIKTLL